MELNNKINWDKNIYIYLIILVIILTSPLSLYHTGLGQDDSAIILASLRLSEYKIFSTDVSQNLFARLLDFSHGGFNLIWNNVIYSIFNLLRIPLYNWVFTFPGVLSTWLTSIIIYLFTLRITKNRIISLCALITYLLCPIVIGMSRGFFSPLNLLRLLYLYSTALALETRSNIWRRGSVVVLFLLIFSDNGFVLFMLFGAVMIFYYNYALIENTGYIKRIYSTLKKVIRYYWDVTIVLPVLLLIIFTILYYYPIHAGYGYLSYTLHKKVVYQLSFSQDIVKIVLSNFGIGLGPLYLLVLLLPILIYRAINNYEHRPAILVLYLWLMVWSLLAVSVKPWELGQIYLAQFTAIPLVILTTVILNIWWNKYRKVTTALIVVMLGLNVISCASLIFNVPYEGAFIFGAPRSYDYAKYFKSIGTILRNAGNDPLINRKIPHDRIPIIIAGNKVGVTPYPAILYWGSDVGDKPNEYTEVIIELKGWLEDQQHLEQSLTYARENNFVLKKVINDGDQPVAWLYYRNNLGREGSVKTEYYQYKALDKEFNRTYANMDNIKTTGAHAL